MKKIAMVLALTAGVLTCQRGYGVDFQDLISGDNIPLTVELQELDSSWRQVAISGQFEMGDYMKTWANLFGGSLYSNVYYTQGQTTTIGGETYAIAYRLSPEGEGLSFKSIMENMLSSGCSEASLPNKLTRETSLSLSLLNLRTIGSLNDVRPFDLERVLADSDAAYQKVKDDCERGQLEALNTQASANLSELGSALLYYTSENDGTLPEMDDAAAVETSLTDWVSDPSVFLHPGTAEPYQPNSSLSGKKLAEITNPEQVAAFYQVTADGDGMRWVVFLDGSVKQISEGDWSNVREVSGLP